MRIKKLVVIFKNPNEQPIEKTLETIYYWYDTYEKSYESWCNYVDMNHTDSGLKKYLSNDTYQGKDVKEMYEIIQYILL